MSVAVGHFYHRGGDMTSFNPYFPPEERKKRKKTTPEKRKTEKSSSEIRLTGVFYIYNYNITTQMM